MRAINARFRPAAKLPRNLDKDRALARLAEIASSPGGLTTAAALRERTVRRSPLRVFFTEDPGTAAEQWWRKEAADMIGMVVVTVEEDDGTTYAARRWVPSQMEVREREPTNAGSVYLPIERVLSDTELRAEQMAIALMELRKWADRWVCFRGDLRRVFTAIDAHTQARQREA